MRLNNFFSGFIAACALLGFIFSLAFWQDWVVMKSESVRDSMASFALASIIYERQNYKGAVDTNGCYMFPPERQERIQEVVKRYRLTSEDLMYPKESLLCHGFIIPADLGR